MLPQGRSVWCIDLLQTTLQHTKHVAPMPEVEEGEGGYCPFYCCMLANESYEALPGMNASGGAAAPLNDASEEFGTNAPRSEQFGDDDTSASTTTNAKAGASSSLSASKNASVSQQPASGKTTSSSSTSKSGQDTHSSHEKKGKHDLEDVSREKAKRYVNMNEEDVQHAGTPNSKNDAERSSQRAPKDVGPKEDIELLHGKASLDANDKSRQSCGSGAKSGSGNASGNGRQNSNDDKGSSGKGGNGSGHHEEDPMRHNAEKFVNLDE
jgi:hypothetical protein